MPKVKVVEGSIAEPVAEVEVEAVAETKPEVAKWGHVRRGKCECGAKH